MKYFNEMPIGAYYPQSSGWEWSDVGYIKELPCYGFNFDVDNSKLTYAGCNSAYAEYINGNYAYYKEGTGFVNLNNPYKVIEFDDNNYIALIITFPANSDFDNLLYNPPYNNVNKVLANSWTLNVNYYYYNNNVMGQAISSTLLVPVHAHSETVTVVSYDEGDFTYNYLTLAISTYSSSERYLFYSNFRKTTVTYEYGYANMSDFSTYSTITGKTYRAYTNINIPTAYYIDYDDLGSSPS